MAFHLGLKSFVDFHDEISQIPLIKIIVVNSKENPKNFTKKRKILLYREAYCSKDNKNIS
jgi:hypothetical protein